MADARVTQTHVQAATEGEGGGARVTQTYVLAATQFPSEEVRTTQARVDAAVQSENNDGLRVTQLYVLAAVKGRVENPKIRAWTYTIDGHDFYVLHLGTTETLVYDFNAEQWYVYGAGETDIWQAYTGINWQGGNVLAQRYGTNVVAGDDGNGSLYFLDPESSYDDDRLVGEATPREFAREVYGQVATRSFDSIPCYGVQLMGSVGEMTEAALTTVTLYTSDDQGRTYDSQGTVTIANAAYDTRVEWWSLGSFTAPGRLFKVKDNGTLHRIDYLEMIEPPREQ